MKRTPFPLVCCYISGGAPLPVPSAKAANCNAGRTGLRQSLQFGDCDLARRRVRVHLPPCSLQHLSAFQKLWCCCWRGGVDRWLRLRPSRDEVHSSGCGLSSWAVGGGFFFVLVITASQLGIPLSSFCASFWLLPPSSAVGYSFLLLLFLVSRFFFLRLLGQLLPVLPLLRHHFELFSVFRLSFRSSFFLGFS